MASYHHQWIFGVNGSGNPVEILNGARTASYLADVASVPVVDISDVLAFGGCEAYTLKPCTVQDDLTVDEWLPMGFTTVDSDDEPAPWYDGVPGSASTEALGFWIEEWTGLDGAHHTRTVKPVGSRPSGARFGPQAAKHRTWKMNVVLFGQTERGLEYLFRWLEQTLLSCCDPCAETAWWVRLTCPELYDPEDGVYMVRNVALLEGPTWEDEPVPGAGCAARRVSFTVGVGDPCLYAPQEVVALAQSLDVNDEIQNNGDFPPNTVTSKPINYRPACDSISASNRISALVPAGTIGFTAPIVQIRTGSGGGLPELRVLCIEDMTGTTDDGCYGKVVGEVDLARLPKNSEIFIDFGRREVLYRDSSTGGYVPGWAYVMPNSTNRKRWGSLTCRDGYVVVEQNSLAYEYSAPDIVDVDGNVMEFTTTPEVNIWARRRVGCC